MQAIISHDAGGAEILSSFVLRNKTDCIFVLEGPARKIFERKLGNIETTTLSVAISKVDNILCGSSWQSDLEFNAVKLAKKMNIPSATFLDHWVNYETRFIRNEETCLPDEIIVGDITAEKLAKEIFTGVPIFLLENPYFVDICDDLSKVSQKKLKINKNKLSILYVCEPVREPALIQYGDENYLGYTEEDALRYFLRNIDAISGDVQNIVIRPHPSENIDKYNWVQDEFDLPIKGGGSQSLLEEIVETDVVVGCESMAMIVALLADKRVISSIPLGGRNCMLPHEDIERLQDILKR